MDTDWHRHRQPSSLCHATYCLACPDIERRTKKKSVTSTSSRLGNRPGARSIGRKAWRSGANRSLRTIHLAHKMGFYRRSKYCHQNCPYESRPEPYLAPE